MSTYTEVQWVGDSSLSPRETRKFRRVNGCLCVADYSTPPLDQRYGYVLEAAS